jgi:hypothetical protein
VVAGDGGFAVRSGAARRDREAPGLETTVEAAAGAAAAGCSLEASAEGF